MRLCCGVMWVMFVCMRIRLVGLLILRCLFLGKFVIFVLIDVVMCRSVLLGIVVGLRLRYFWSSVVWCMMVNMFMLVFDVGLLVVRLIVMFCLKKGVSENIGMVSLV